MTKEYNSNSERRYTAPEAPLIVEPESMTPKIPGWVKGSMLFLATAYFLVNTGGFIIASTLREGGMSKSKIEERIDKIYGDEGGLEKFFFDNLMKPGRELVYLIRGDGENNKNDTRI